MNYFEEPSKARLPVRMKEEIVNCLLSELQNIAIKVFIDVSVPISEDDLYKEIIPENFYNIMSTASLLMPLRPRYSQMRNVTLPINIDADPIYIVFTIMVNNTNSKYIDWLWPQQLKVITQDSELGKILFPIIDISIQWQTTLELFKLFSKNATPGVVLHMLPWLPEFLLDIYNENISIYHNNPKQQQLFKREIEKYLASGVPRYIPGMSNWFSNVCNYGTELLSTAKFISIQKQSQKTCIIPCLNSNLIENGLLDHFNNFLYDLNIKG